MKIERSQLNEAARQGVITPEQSEKLWALFTAQDVATPGFTFTHVLYYLGGLIAIGAMSLFMNLGWELFGGRGIFLIAVGYALAALWLTHYFLDRKRLPIPAGIMATFVVVLVPLAVYGLQVWLGWWDDKRPYRAYHTHIDWRWIMMESVTLAAGAVMLWRYRLPFLVMPVAVTLWYMSMDLAPFLFGAEAGYAWDVRKWVSLWFGLLVVLLALWVDIRSRHGPDFAFWLYLFGVAAFWGGLSSLRSDSELNKLIYCLINIGLIFVGAALSRRVFAVFGGLGVAGYLGYLSYRVFKDSLLFPFVLTLIGLGVVWLGVIWQRREAEITRRLRGLLPAPLRELLEQRHG